MSFRLSPKALAAFTAAVVAAAAAFTQPWEGTSRTSYGDVVGIATACTGHVLVGPDKTLGQYFSKEQCELWFKDDITAAAQYVMSCVHTPMTVNQAASFTSLTFNIGGSAFCSSTVARKANAGDKAGSCRAILLWVYAGGRKIQGLVNRRNAEYRLCMTP